MRIRIELTRGQTAVEGTVLNPHDVAVLKDLLAGTSTSALRWWIALDDVRAGAPPILVNLGRAETIVELR